MFALLGPLLGQGDRERWKRLATMKKRRENLHEDVTTGMFDKRIETSSRARKLIPRCSFRGYGGSGR